MVDIVGTSIHPTTASAAVEPPPPSEYQPPAPVPEPAPEPALTPTNSNSSSVLLLFPRSVCRHDDPKEGSVDGSGNGRVVTVVVVSGSSGGGGAAAVRAFGGGYAAIEWVVEARVVVVVVVVRGRVGCQASQVQHFVTRKTIFPVWGIVKAEFLATKMKQFITKVMD
ncbi:hypothetical protein M0802_003194 [Mischocyttarus mexicanus]|nr:hypothetical protein M0802_003194 [Mischocyttarus mexicanus]